MQPWSLVQSGADGRLGGSGILGFSAGDCVSAVVPECLRPGVCSGFSGWDVFSGDAAGTTVSTKAARFIKDRSVPDNKNQLGFGSSFGFADARLSLLSSLFAGLAEASILVKVGSMAIGPVTPWLSHERSRTRKLRAERIESVAATKVKVQCAFVRLGLQAESASSSSWG